MSSQILLSAGKIDQEIDEISILEFLNNEQECTDPSDLDIESIFEEINRLSDNTDDRSVEVLMKEAEYLMMQDPLSLILEESEFSQSSDAVISTHRNISKESTPREMRMGGAVDKVSFFSPKVILKKIGNNFLVLPKCKILV